MKNLLPPVWLIVLIAGLSVLPETVYTPSLPDIAHSLQTSDSMVEYTLTIYLFGIAFGSLFWGKFSDKAGRKPCVLGGLCIFIIGCVGCYFSDSITGLMVNRFIQAFGASVGSVLGQAVCRDAFHGPALGKVYSSTISALALFPAIGPVIGGLIAENLGWSSTFLFLIVCALILIVFVTLKLPETNAAHSRKPVPILKVAFSLFKDKKVLGFGILVAGANAINFSYFAEGSFYLIQILGLSPTHYGLSFIAIAGSTVFGGIVSRKLHNNHSSQKIMGYGLTVIAVTGLLFSALILWNVSISQIPQSALIGITVVAQMSFMFGITMTTSTALALALVDYKWCIGTASSLFGFFYYCLLSLFVFGMGALHNDTLLPMPLYFLGIGIFMLIIRRMIR